MNRWLVRAGAALAVMCLFAGAANADDKKGGKMVTACPVCKMKLSDKKTKDNPVAIKLSKNGKTQYCCAKCKMPASVLVKDKMDGGKGKMAPKKSGKM
jgi:Fe-S oxidoreductase